MEDAVAAETAHILQAYHEACPLKMNRFKKDATYQRNAEKKKRRFYQKSCCTIWTFFIVNGILLQASLFLFFKKPL